MIKIFFKYLSRLIKSIFSSVETTNTLTTTQEADSIITKEEKKEVQEIPFFTRTNDLVNEFSYEPTPVHSSNFSSNEIIGWLQADGSITKQKYGMDLATQDGELLQKEELLADDVQFLKDHPDYVKSTENKTIAEYAIGYDPYKDTIVEGKIQYYHGASPNGNILYSHRLDTEEKKENTED